MATNIRLIYKLLLLVVGGLLVLISTLLLFSGYVDQQAKKEAQNFCNSIHVDESLPSLLGKCKTTKKGCSSWKPVNGIARHQAFFHGFLLHAYACEIETKDGIVISTFFEEHID